MYFPKGKTVNDLLLVGINIFSLYALTSAPHWPLEDDTHLSECLQ